MFKGGGPSPMDNALEPLRDELLSFKSDIIAHIRTLYGELGHGPIGDVDKALKEVKHCRNLLESSMNNLMNLPSHHEVNDYI